MTKLWEAISFLRVRQRLLCPWARLSTQGIAYRQMAQGESVKSLNGTLQSTPWDLWTLSARQVLLLGATHSCRAGRVAIKTLVRRNYYVSAQRMLRRPHKLFARGTITLRGPSHWEDHHTGRTVIVKEQQLAFLHIQDRSKITGEGIGRWGRYHRDTRRASREISLEFRS